MAQSTPPAPHDISAALNNELRALTAGGRISHTGLGPAHLHAALPFLRDSNLLRVTRPWAPGDMHAALAQVAPLFTRIGAELRLLVDSPSVHARVADELLAHGWQARRLELWMGDTRAVSPQPQTRARVRWAAGPEELDAVDGIHRHALTGVDDAVAWQVITARRQELDEALNLRWCVARLGESPHIAGVAASFTAQGLGSVQWVRTRESERGQGVAEALVGHLIAGLNAQGVDQLSLLVEAQNQAARRLYKRVGLKAVARVEVFER